MDQVLKSEMTQLKTDMSEMGLKVDRMYYALMGNDIAQDGGLVKRIIDLEVESAAQRKEIETLKTAKGKSDFQLYVLWGLGGGFLVLLIRFLFELISMFLKK